LVLLSARGPREGSGLVDDIASWKTSSGAGSGLAQARRRAHDAGIRRNSDATLRPGVKGRRSTNSYDATKRAPSTTSSDGRGHPSAAQTSTKSSSCESIASGPRTRSGAFFPLVLQIANRVLIDDANCLLRFQWSLRHMAPLDVVEGTLAEHVAVQSIMALLSSAAGGDMGAQVDGMNYQEVAKMLVKSVESFGKLPHGRCDN